MRKHERAWDGSNACVETPAAVEALEGRTLFSALLASDVGGENISLAVLADIDAAQQAQHQAPIQASSPAVSTASPVVRIADGAVVGSARLVRTEQAVTAHFMATGVPAGAYTLWTRVDTPGQGPISGFLGGHVVGQGGTLEFSARIRAGEFLSGNPDLPSGTFQDPLNSTIRLVVRNHGEADPVRIHEQITTFEPTNAANYLISVHQPST